MADQGVGRSARVLAAAADALRASASVRFIREASDGSIDDDAFAAYLAIEERFVRTAVRVTGLLVWRSTGWPAAAGHARAVAALIGPQLDWFRTTRSRWTGSENHLAEATERAGALANHVVTLAETEGSDAALTAMFAAETLYSGWCTAAAAQSIERFADLRIWIDMHATPAFASGVASLAAAVDAIPVLIDDTTVVGWFVDTLAAENVFHDSIYPTDHREFPA